MRVLVSRLAGDILSPEVIVDDLAVLTSVGVERGKAYLYTEGIDKRLYSVKLPYRGVFYPGMLLGISNMAVGDSFVGRVTEVTVSSEVEDNTLCIYTNLSVERCVL